MNSIDQELALLLNSVDKLEEKRFIDKSTAEKVAAAGATDLPKQFCPAPNRLPRQSNAVIRVSGEKVWSDPSLAEWPENDYRIHVQGLPADAMDRDLANAFRQYRSFAKAKVVSDSSGRSKRYGFVSLLDVNDYIDAMKTMSHAFIKGRRVSLSPSKWREKSLPRETV
jgi:RNA recognition motif-containing protein